MTSKAGLIYTKDDGTVALLDLDPDMNIHEFYEACARLALAASYHPTSVEEAFNLDED